MQPGVYCKDVIEDIVDYIILEVINWYQMQGIQTQDLFYSGKNNDFKLLNCITYTRPAYTL